MFWKKSIPWSYSICPYVHRTFWIGLLLLPSMVVILAPIKLLVYHLLYKHILQPLTHSDLLSSLCIWVIVMLLIIRSGLESALPSIIVSVGIIAAVVLAIIGIIAGMREIGVFSAIGWVFKALWWIPKTLIFKPIGAYGDFSFEVMARYYIPADLRLKNHEYRYLNKNQFLVKLGFWVPPFLPYAILFALPFAAPKVFVNEGDGVTGNFYLLFAFFAAITLVYITIFFSDRSKARKNAYVRYPELKPLEPIRKPSAFKTHVSRPIKNGWKNWVEENWKPFYAWVQAKHEKVCPFVEFVD
jgi:hypothetical protein